MTIRNVPVTGQGAGWNRDAANAINSILARKSYMVLSAEGMPDAGQTLFRFRSPVAFTIIADSTSGHAGTGAAADADVDLLVGGVTAASITYAAGQDTATPLTSDITVPADTWFEVLAPNPQDATLANLSLSIAIIR